MHLNALSWGLMILPAVLAQDKPNKCKANFLTGGMSELDGELLKLPFPKYTIHKWKPGMSTMSCLEAAQKDKWCTVEGTEMYDIKYDDCEEPWLVCRCSDNLTPIETIATRLGQVPVGVRQYTRSSRWYTSAVGGGAFANGFDLTFFGDYSKSQSVIMHEASHNLDHWTNNGTGFFLSDNDPWKKAIKSDKCTLDDYAKSSYTEAFAQASVALGYEMNFGPIINKKSNDKVDADCIKNQMDYLRSLHSDAWKYGADKKCTKRTGYDKRTEPTCISDKDKNEGRCNGVEYEDGTKRLATRDTSSIEILQEEEGDLESRLAAQKLVDNIRILDSRDMTEVRNVLRRRTQRIRREIEHLPISEEDLATLTRLENEFKEHGHDHVI